jgi:hypothetical protein
MNTPTRITRLLLILAVILGAESGTMARERDFVPLRELRGITKVDLEVDGLPNPVEGTEITEESLAEDVTAALRKGGIKVAGPDDWDERPTLHLRVLAVKHETTYFYSIVVELEERCTPERDAELSIPWCTTWSFYPRLGVFPVERGEVLWLQVLEATKQFVDAWRTDNGKRPKKRKADG